MPSEIILVSGPIRSGKSDFAEDLAKEKASLLANTKTPGSPGAVAPISLVAYIATAAREQGDEEMEQRIKAHQARRPSSWLTLEELYQPTLALHKAYKDGRRVILLDSFAMLVSNHLLRLESKDKSFKDRTVYEEQAFTDVLAPILATFSLARDMELCLILVTEEVGWSLTPDNFLGRAYQNLLGKINSFTAKVASEVWLVVMGLPQKLK